MMDALHSPLVRLICAQDVFPQNRNLLRSMVRFSASVYLSPRSCRWYLIKVEMNCWRYFSSPLPQASAQLSFGSPKTSELRELLEVICPIPSSTRAEEPPPKHPWSVLLQLPPSTHLLSPQTALKTSSSGYEMDGVERRKPASKHPAAMGLGQG